MNSRHSLAKASFFARAFRGALTLSLSAFPLVPNTAHAAPTWQPLGPSGGSIDEVQLSPSAPDTLFAIAQGDLFRSDDGGVRWRLTGGQGLRSIAVSPANSQHLLAVRSRHRRVVASRDGGRTFRPSDSGLGSIEVLSLTFDPRLARRVYAATLFGLYRSDNFGASWRSVGPPALPSLARVVVSPHDSNLLFALELLDRPPRGGELGTLWRSTDGGRTWSAQEMTRGSAASESLDVPVFDPRTPNRLYLIAGSLRVSVNRGATWQEVEATQPFYSIAISAADGTFYALLRRGFGGGFDLGVSRDRGRTFTGHAAPSITVTALVVSPTRAGLLWLGTDRGVYRSLGAAASWRASSSGIHRLVASSISAASDGGVFLGAFGEGVFHRDRDARAWVRRSFGLEVDPRDRSALAQVTADPEDPNLAWALTKDGLFKSEDRGARWQSLENHLPSFGALSPLSAQVWSDPNRAGAILVSLENYGLYRSLDGGETFEPLTTGLPGRHPTLFKIVFDPHRRDTFHALGTQPSNLPQGPTLWRWTEASGLTATPSPSGLYLEALTIDPTTVDRLYVGTRESAWRVDLGAEPLQWLESPFDEPLGSVRHPARARAAQGGDPLSGCGRVVR